METFYLYPYYQKYRKLGFSALYSFKKSVEESKINEDKYNPNPENVVVYFRGIRIVPHFNQYMILFPWIEGYVDTLKMVKDWIKEEKRKIRRYKRRCDWIFTK